jgi:hypothetical protein|tara:strand:+ start:347 stop:724 length:378 start_codon:yes stop_codon:yes gene_type:complete
MDIQQMLNTYLTSDKKHFKKRNSMMPIELDHFYKVLGVYTKINFKDSLQLAKHQGGQSFRSWLFIKNGGKKYKVNGDTKLAGLKEFYTNRNNSCKTIINRDGNRNLITNNVNGEKIEHLYIYIAE